jgi:alpha-beta hydrolase superfamily lysophospholipase
MLTFRRPRLLGVAALAASLLPLAGCGGERESKAAPAKVVRGLCPNDHARTQTGFSFRASDGARLVGVIRGSGRVGIIVAHGHNASLCVELPLVDDLAQRGYTVLAYDARGSGASPTPSAPGTQNHVTADVIGAARELRRRGIETILLVGDSLGGTTVVAAAPYVEPPPAGVVSVGGPPTLRAYFGDDLDALGRASRLEIPLLYLVSHDDPFVATEDARALVRRARSRDKRLVVYPGAYHAIGGLFVEAPYHQQPYRTFLAFLASRSSPSGSGQG